MWMLRIRFRNRKGELTELRYDRKKPEDAVDMLLKDEVKNAITAHYRDYPSPVLVEVASIDSRVELAYRSTIRSGSTFGQIVATIYETLLFEVEQ